MKYIAIILLLFVLSFCKSSDTPIIEAELNRFSYSHFEGNWNVIPTSRHDQYDTIILVSKMQFELNGTGTYTETKRCCVGSLDFTNQYIEKCFDYRFYGDTMRIIDYISCSSGILDTQSITYIRYNDHNGTYYAVDTVFFQPISYNTGIQFQPFFRFERID